MDKDEPSSSNCDRSKFGRPVPVATGAPAFVSRVNQTNSILEDLLELYTSKAMSDVVIEVKGNFQISDHGVDCMTNTNDGFVIEISHSLLINHCLKLNSAIPAGCVHSSSK